MSIPDMDILICSRCNAESSFYFAEPSGWRIGPDPRCPDCYSTRHDLPVRIIQPPQSPVPVPKPSNHDVSGSWWVRQGDLWLSSLGAWRWLRGGHWELWWTRIARGTAWYKTTNCSRESRQKPSKACFKRPQCRDYRTETDL